MPAGGLDLGGRVGIGTTSSGTLTVDGTNAAISVAGGSVTASAFFGDGSHLSGLTATDNTKVLKAGDAMAGALTLAADPTAALQAATKQYVDSWSRPCVNPNDPADVMVPVGPWCVDKYEASVWSTPTGVTQYGTSNDNYPCREDGQTCGAGAANPIYARSVPAVLPSASIDWYRANIACINSGKELLPSAIWQMAASGTPDSSAGTAGAACNISGAGPHNTDADLSCVSRYGGMEWWTCRATCGNGRRSEDRILL